MLESVWFVLAIVAVALVFDFINGFHDSANSIATIVSTRVLSPVAAVAWAAFFNFVAAFGFGTAVAKTIGSGLIDLSIVDPVVILAGLLGAIGWDVATWYLGIPSSSSHALIGGYGGAALAKAGVDALILGGWVKPILFIFVAPILGMALGLGLMVGVAWTFRRARPVSVDKHFPPAPVGLCGGVQPEPRHQRRAENHGDHRRPPGQLPAPLHRVPDPGISSHHGRGHPHVGDPLGTRGDRRGHGRRRMAHRQDDGVTAHQAEAGARVLR
jgi:phosphate/sulfate permease